MTRRSSTAIDLDGEAASRTLVESLPLAAAVRLPSVVMSYVVGDVMSTVKSGELGTAGIFVILMVVQAH